MSIKQILMDLLQNKKIGKFEFDADTYSLNESIDEISTKSLLNMSIHYIQGYMCKNIEYYESFIKEIEYFKIPEKKFVEIRKSVLLFKGEDEFEDQKEDIRGEVSDPNFPYEIYANKNVLSLNGKIYVNKKTLNSFPAKQQIIKNNTSNDSLKNNLVGHSIRPFLREDKIFITRFQNNFLKRPINLEDRGYVLEMLTYFYCRSINELVLDISEKQIVRHKDEVCGYKPISITRIDKNFFGQRNAPTMTLDEYAEKVKSEAIARGNTDYKIGDESEEKELTRAELIKRDEIRDNLEKGNTYRRG